MCFPVFPRIAGGKSDRPVAVSLSLRSLDTVADMQGYLNYHGSRPPLYACDDYLWKKPAAEDNTRHSDG